MIGRFWVRMAYNRCSNRQMFVIEFLKYLEDAWPQLIGR